MRIICEQPMKGGSCGGILIVCGGEGGLRKSRSAERGGIVLILHDPTPTDHERSQTRVPRGCDSCASPISFASANHFQMPTGTY